MQWSDLSQQLSGALFQGIIFFQSLFQALGFLPAPCEAPLQYTFGTIDSRFEISQEEVQRAVTEAEKVWEGATGRNLFEYNAEQGLAVTFVYDERQARTQAGQDLQKKLENLNVDASEQEVTAKVKQYETTKQEYERQKAQYEQAVTRYNAKIEKINSSGGATSAQQKDLQDEYDDIQKQYKNLEEKRQQVNSLAESTNDKIEATRSLVEAYNKEVTTFQDLYGGEGEVFDQGVYTGQDITIYQYDDFNRLVLVLAHEMGHALGIDHVEDPEALMYYLMRDQDIKNIALSGTDKEALEQACQKPSLF